MAYNESMATLDDVARSLGLSKRAVRSRIDALGDMLEGHLTRGERNRLIFKGEAVAILQRLEELRQREGLLIRQAVNRLRGELAEGTEASGMCLLVKSDVDVAFLHEVVRDLCRERDRWREYALALQSVLPPGLGWLDAVAPATDEDRRLN